MDRPMRFSSFVVKVASRCNLNCDYCYMYQHADQSWKNKPKVLSEQNRQLFIKRLKDYAIAKKHNKILIIYHGGEPLLFGADNLVAWSIQIAEGLSEVGCKVDFGIQTNGVLLKEKYLQEFEKYNISVSLSVDGPKEIHDHHRLDIKNRPTFDKVYESLQLLKKYPRIFSGCITVIDPNFDPYLLFDFFNKNDIAEFNILIPDANYVTPPKGRDKNPDLYKNWLIKAFDVWFDHFSHIKCKFFDQLLMGVMGHATQTDSFGLGDISLLVLETDGTYHNHDVLKITEENTSALGLNLENNAIEEAETSEKIVFHRHLLTREGLSTKCQSCKHVNICGGGFIAHRFSTEGYKNPTIYCYEMYALIDHIIYKVYTKLTQSPKRQEIGEFDQSMMDEFWYAKTSANILEKLKNLRALRNYSKLHAFISYFQNKFPTHSEIIKQCKNLSFEQARETLLRPTVNAWIRAMSAQSTCSPVLNIEGQELPIDVNYFDDFYRMASSDKKTTFSIQSKDRWFRLSMGSNIILDHPTEVLDAGRQRLNEAFSIIKEYDSDLYNEMLRINNEIQLVKDLNAHPDKDVSFSDETLPSAIFLSVWKSDGLISPHVIAASLIHEHLHQKLYLLMNRFELFNDKTTLIYSPWPKVLRPPQGVLHAVYVFTFVAKFWNAMLSNNSVDLSYVHYLENNLESLDSCIREIKDKVDFTNMGSLFFESLMKEYDALVQNSFITKV